MRVRLLLVAFVVCLCAPAPAQALKQPLGSEFPISTPSNGSSGGTDIAADSAANRYFAVWSKGRLSQPGMKLWGRLLDHEGRPVGEPVAISDEADYIFFSNPIVTYNAALREYLVVWAWEGGSPNVQELRAQRISDAGEKIGGRITVWSGKAQTPSIACSSHSGACLVAWRWSDVHARLIAPGGGLPGPAFTLSAGSGGDAEVGYSAHDDQFFVAWDEVGGVMGQTVGSDGAPSAPAFPIASAGYGRPRMAYNTAAGEFAVVFDRPSVFLPDPGGVTGARVRLPGTVFPMVTISRENLTASPRIAFDAQEHSYLVWWRYGPGGHGGGRFVSSDLSSEQVAADPVGIYEHAAYNSAQDEYLLIRPYCDQPDDPSAVCVRRIGVSAPAAGASDRTGPTLRMTVRRLQRVVRQRGLVLRARCGEACAVRASARITLPGASRSVALRPVSKSLAANARTKLKLKASKRALRKLRHALRSRHRLGARLTVTATDSSRNRTIGKRTIRARR